MGATTTIGYGQGREIRWIAGALVARFFATRASFLRRPQEDEVRQSIRRGGLQSGKHAMLYTRVGDSSLTSLTDRPPTLQQ